MEPTHTPLFWVSNRREGNRLRCAWSGVMMTPSQAARAYAATFPEERPIFVTFTISGVEASIRFEEPPP